ncbi:MAG: SgcJ/EcaC family oxidoreductase [Planctomycetales bacterium]|nr:SgcJ/EcaC family oxidoreductase [Planctomycetales bacterium]
MNLVDLSLAAGIAMAILFTRGTQCACGQELSGATVVTEDAAPIADSGREDSEIKVIRDQIAHYVEAFNRHDGKSLAGFRTKSGEFTATSGHTWRGAAELQECFESYFRDQPDARLELAETDVRILSPSVAMETGLAHVVRPDQAPVSTQYEAIHVRTADGWRIDR